MMMMMIMVMMMQLEMILPNRAYAFFSHTHKAQKENMPLLDKVRVCVSNHVVCSYQYHNLLLVSSFV